MGGDLRLFTIRRLSAGLSLDAYRADVDGMILWFPDFRFVWSPRNFDVHRRGAEAALDLSADLLDTRLRATAARSRVTYAGSALEGQVAYRPEWTAGATLSSSWRGWSTELGARYTGERRTVPGSSLNTLDPFWTLDLRLAFGWTLGAWRTTARATVANLLDERAAMIPDYPLPGRAWGLELSFTPRR